MKRVKKEGFAMMKMFFSAGIAAAMLLSAGCVTREFKTDVGGIQDERVSYENTWLFSLKVLEVTSRINNEGDLAVTAALEVSRPGFFTYALCGNPQLKVSYCFEWLDAKGKASPKVWHDFKAFPGSIISFSGVAPSSKYVNFKLYVAVGDKNVKAKCVAAAPAAKTVKAPAKKAAPAKAAVKAPAKKAAPAKAAVKAPAKKAAPAKAAVKAPAKKAAPAKAAVKAPAKKAAPAKAAVKAPAKKAAPGKAAVKAPAKKAAPAKAAVKAPAQKAASSGNIVPDNAANAKGKDGKLAEPLK